jgi:hypothetical protein
VYSDVRSQRCSRICACGNDRAPTIRRSTNLIRCDPHQRRRPVLDTIPNKDLDVRYDVGQVRGNKCSHNSGASAIERSTIMEKRCRLPRPSPTNDEQANQHCGAVVSPEEPKWFRIMFIVAGAAHLPRRQMHATRTVMDCVGVRPNAKLRWRLSSCAPGSGFLVASLDGGAGRSRRRRYEFKGLGWGRAGDA